MSAATASDPRPVGFADLIQRFRHGKPASREERGAAAGATRLWWKETGEKQATSSRQFEASRFSASRPPLPRSYTPLYDTLDNVPGFDGVAPAADNEELDNLDLGASWDALLRVRSGVRTAHRYANPTESLFSIPDLLELHKSLEVEPVAPAVVPPSAQPSPPAPVPVPVSPEPQPEPEETLEQMIEDLDVTMMRLNWRCAAIVPLE